MSLSSRELLLRLEDAFPDRLPSFKNYSPERVLKDIGNQEVLMLMRRLLDEPN